MSWADWLSVAIPLLSTLACGATAWRQRGRIRLAWALLGVSGAGWAGASAAAGYLSTDSLPFPLVDLRFAAVMGPAIIALALLPAAPPLTSDRLRTLLDGAVVAGSLLFVSWGTGLGLAYRAAQPDLSQHLNSLAHPFGDLLAAVMLIFVLYGAVRTARVSRLLLALGLLLLALADSAATWDTIRPDAASVSGLISWASVAGFAVLAAAAIWEARQSPLDSARGWLYAAAATVLYLPLVAAAILVVVWELLGSSVDPFLLWNGLAVVGLVVARELLTLRTNRLLRRTFDQRLGSRTEELSRNEARFRTLVNGSPDATVLFDKDGRITYESQSIERVLGRSAGSVADRSWLSLFHPDEVDRLKLLLEKSQQAPGAPIAFEAKVSHGDDGWRHAELTITNRLGESVVGGFVLSLRDITERKALDDQLAHHALHDSLTGLVNRAVFRDRLDQSVVRAARRREQPALLLVDVDGMQRLGEALGNQAADEVLVAVADRLRESVRAGDTVARFGTDEFAVLVEDTEEQQAPGRVAERILTELARVKIGPKSKPLTAGIGIAVLPPGLENPDELLRHADTALAEAKAAGAGKIAIYERSMSTVAASQLELEADLQRAIERKEFVVHYQPIVRLRDGAPTAVEALVRWVHPWRGMLLPGDFILAADKTGAIVSLGRWLLLEASRQVRRWQQELQLPTLGLSVNVSIRQLRDEGLANDIRHVLSEVGFEPSLLMLEMRESALLEDLQQSIAVLGKLKDVGAGLAIDDCRSGPSSLGYVRHLPVDTIKIDRSFVMNLGKSREREQVEAVIRTGQWLKVALVAEGIEEPGQASELIAMGCELGQGFHYSKPLAAAQMFDYLERHRAQKAA